MSLIQRKVSAKVDLTENRDFSGVETNNISFRLINNLFDVDTMTNTEWKILKEIESIFGRRIHKNEAEKIFELESKINEKFLNLCQRCGKELKSPWKRVYDLCPECDKALYESINGKIPWKEQDTGFRNNNDDRDVLTLR